MWEVIWRVFPKKVVYSEKKKFDEDELHEMEKWKSSFSVG